MLEARSLTKCYASIPAVNEVSFTLRPGEILGYLGPNGSGKTTTVSMLTGLLEPTRGKIFFDGRDIKEDLIAYKRRLGYVPEEPHLYTHLTGREYLQLAGRLRSLREKLIAEKCDDLLRLMSLYPHRHSPIASYSKGVVVFAILPLFAALLPFYVMVWGWSLALRHTLFALLLALLLMELMFLGFAKFPFACSYSSGRKNPIAVFMVYVFVLLIYVVSGSAVEPSIVLRPARLALFALLAGGALVFAVARRRSRRASLRLIFEEQPEPAVQELGLAARE